MGSSFFVVMQGRLQELGTMFSMYHHIVSVIFYMDNPLITMANLNFKCHLYFKQNHLPSHFPVNMALSLLHSTTSCKSTLIITLFFVYFGYHSFNFCQHLQSPDTGHYPHLLPTSHNEILHIYPPHQRSREGLTAQLIRSSKL